MKENNNCPFCNSIADAIPNYNYNTVIWDCPACGQFKLTVQSFENGFLKPNIKDMVATYLFYNGVHLKGNKLFKGNRQYICLDSEPYKSDNDYSEDVTIDQIMAFYNIDFTEKISLILLDIAKNTRYFSDYVEYSFNQLLSLEFCKRWDDDDKIYSNNSLINQAFFILNYLKENNLVDYEFHNPNTNCKIKMLSSGWARIEKAEQDNSQKKNAFIAMSFDPSMDDVRKTLKNAIISNGYNPRIMDEIEHNHQIVPEMLHEIRQAKFVIAELTTHNNGAYFEAGYALGIGKEVIQVCRKDTFGTDGHFDVKQVNTVLWENQEDLYKRLDARIKATIY